MFFKLIKKRGSNFIVSVFLIVGFFLIFNTSNINAAAPNYTQVWLNTSLLATGYMVNFSTNWTDDSALDSFIFSINQSGDYVNSTPRSFKGVVNNSANVTRITAPYGYNVTWRFWANDSENAWNVTPIQSFIVTCDYNGTGNWNINATCVVSQRAFQINGNISIFDSGNLSLKNANLTINNTNYLKFITVNSQGILESLDLDNDNNTMQDRTQIIGLWSRSCSGTIGVDCMTITGDPTCAGYTTDTCTYNGVEDFCENVQASCSAITNPSVCTENLCTLTNNPNHGLTSNRNSKIIFKNSFFENFGLHSGGVFGKNGFDLNGTSVIINNTFTNASIIAIYNNDTTFDGNKINGSLNYTTLIGTENITIANNHFNVTYSGGAAILLINTSNINITDNSFLSSASGFVGIKTQDSLRITIYDNIINSVSASLNQPELYLLRTNNSNLSYNTLLGRSTNLLIWDSYNNSIEYINTSSTIADSLLLINSSLNDFNKLNINTSTAGNGITLVQAHNNSIKNSIIENRRNGITFDLSSDNKLNNIYMMSYTTTTNSTKFMTSSANNVISNSILNTTGNDLTTISGYNYFRNVSFNQSNSYASGSGYVNVQWYLEVNVSYYNGSVAAGTNVTLFNRTNVYYFSDLAGSNGLVSRKNVTEYIYNGTGKIFYTNYAVTANTSASGIANFTGPMNITSNMQYNISLQVAPDTTSPRWVAGSVNANQTTIYQNTLINFTTNWTDETQLDSWIFSLNQTGTYVNSTSIAFAAGLNISSNISMITALAGTNVTWRFWANDSSNNWNYSEGSFLVSSVAATNNQNSVGSGGTPFESILQIDNVINETNVSDIENNQSSDINQTYQSNQSNLSNINIFRSASEDIYLKKIIISIFIVLISIGFIVLYLSLKYHKNKMK